MGDPLNAVKIFNEKKADELLVLDIDATREGREPDYDMIGKLAVECRMPLCYGGGVQSVEQVRRICGLGVEKVAISSAATENPNRIVSMAERVGSQSVVVVLDVKKRKWSRGYEVWTHNGQKNTGQSVVDCAKQFSEIGAGEIVVNSVDHDGAMKGYDFNLVRQVKSVVDVPLTILGGAGSLYDIADLIREFGIIGACAGSLFVFKGPYRAVLINYPTLEEKRELASQSLWAKR